MADDAEKEEKSDDVEVTLSEDGEEGEGGGSKKLNKKKLIILVAVAVLLLGGAGGGAAFFFLSGSDEPEEVVLLPVEYITLEPIVVDLAGSGRRAGYIKLQLTVAISGTHTGVLEEKTPLVLDSIKSHLRDKTKKDLAGRAGTERLRDDLVRIVGRVLSPVEIDTVLFKDIFVQ